MNTIRLIKINIAHFKTNLNFPGDILARYKKRNSTFTLIETIQIMSTTVLIKKMCPLTAKYKENCASRIPLI